MEGALDAVEVYKAEDVLGDELFQKLMRGNLELSKETVIQEVLIYSMDPVSGTEELIAVKIAIATGTVTR